MNLFVTPWKMNYRVIYQVLRIQQKHKTKYVNAISDEQAYHSFAKIINFPS